MSNKVSNMAIIKIGDFLVALAILFARSLCRGRMYEPVVPDELIQL